MPLKNFRLSILFVWLAAQVHAQDGQITINRINQMPDLPQPYLMRDWKGVAVNYDQFVFSTTATGQYLPLISLRPSGVNYPSVSPIQLKTYVGVSGTQAEGINIIPAVVGASLMGINKSDQGGVNWVEKTKDFFNEANGQNVYLNNYSATSGGDWWYDVMPNIFFYQLYSLYPATTDYQTQFTTVADRWLAAVNAMGGSNIPWTVPQMNYRAWNLNTMTGLADGVKEPEAAGGIGWLLYHAYLKTGETKYLDGAEQSLEFLSGLSSNPSYELQLPYGAFVAAKMNAEQGTAYDIEKIINWCFDRGPLRGWGSIVGTWNGADVSGLIGEANDGGNDYAFALNGFQQAGALVPLIKYDKRFARDLAKWTLNVANASRLFYAQYVPSGSQDDYDWSNTNDPNSSIGYEALKELWEGKPLYATGDAKRSGWAPTNLALYGSSSVGYLAAVVEPTDVTGILQLDVNKTDFFLEEAYPTYAFYNPYGEEKQVTITLPIGVHDVYDAISETTILTNVSGTATVEIQSDEVVLLTYLPAGTATEEISGKLYADDVVVDYHYGYNFTPEVRIKSLTAAVSLVGFGQNIEIFAAVENTIAGAVYNWYDNDELIVSNEDSNFSWTVPSVEGEHTLRLDVISNGITATKNLEFTVVEHVPLPPVISEIQSELWYQTGTQAALTCVAVDDNDTNLQYDWQLTGGSVVSQSGANLNWQVPNVEGIYTITCTVTDLDNYSSTITKKLLVKNTTSNTPPLAYYPFDGNVLDYSGNQHHATLVQAQVAPDSRGEPNSAYKFSSGNDLILIKNKSSLNFTDKITLAFWLKLDGLSQESFVVSHGSWEERWKVSVIPDGRLRWTVKTSTATVDLDSSFPLVLNQFYHFTVVYSGYGMELYVDGQLDGFIPHSGQMNITGKAITFGEKEEGVSDYFLRGVLDEVRIYNAALSPDEIITLKDIRNTLTTGIDESPIKGITHPNPFQNEFYIIGLSGVESNDIIILDIHGRRLPFHTEYTQGNLKVIIDPFYRGFLIVKVETKSGVYYEKMISN